MLYWIIKFIRYINNNLIYLTILPPLIKTFLTHRANKFTIQILLYLNVNIITKEHSLPVHSIMLATRPIPTNWTQMLGSAERMVGRILLLELPITVPVAQYQRGCVWRCGGNGSTQRGRGGGVAGRRWLHLHLTVHHRWPTSDGAQRTVPRPIWVLVHQVVDGREWGALAGGRGWCITIIIADITVVVVAVEQR